MYSIFVHKFHLTRFLPHSLTIHFACVLFCPVHTHTQIYIIGIFAPTRKKNTYEFNANKKIFSSRFVFISARLLVRYRVPSIHRQLSLSIRLHWVHPKDTKMAGPICNRLSAEHLAVIYLVHSTFSNYRSFNDYKLNVRPCWPLVPPLPLPIQINRLPTPPRIIHAHHNLPYRKYHLQCQQWIPFAPSAPSVLNVLRSRSTTKVCTIFVILF